MTEYQLPKAYDFKATEQRIYEMWEQSGYFKPPTIPTSRISTRPRSLS